MYCSVQRTHVRRDTRKMYIKIRQGGEIVAEQQNQEIAQAGRTRRWITTASTLTTAKVRTPMNLQDARQKTTSFFHCENDGKMRNFAVSVNADNACSQGRVSVHQSISHFLGIDQG